MVDKLQFEDDSLDSGNVPKRDPNYVPFGNYDDVRTIIASSKFYPVFITGLSGNGKTMMVQQACAEVSRKMYRVNVTVETDEDDLFGGFRLVNGETKWFDGPVIKAMKTGSVLLLDEIDLASTKIMCLQPVLEGRAVLLKKINQVVEPMEGFSILATANTKGRGSDDGKFIGTNILNEAFLERFPLTVEQDYPDSEIELAILEKIFKANKISDKRFAQTLVEWAQIARKTAKDGALDEIITTRRLVHIVNAFGIFKCKKKSFDYCLSRYEPHVKDAYIELYQNLTDENVKL